MESSLSPWHLPRLGITRSQLLADSVPAPHDGPGVARLRRHEHERSSRLALNTATAAANEALSETRLGVAPRATRNGVEREVMEAVAQLEVLAELWSVICKPATTPRERPPSRCARPLGSSEALCREQTFSARPWRVTLEKVLAPEARRPASLAAASRQVWVSLPL